MGHPGLRARPRIRAGPVRQSTHGSCILPQAFGRLMRPPKTSVTVVSSSRPCTSACVSAPFGLVMALAPHPVRAASPGGPPHRPGRLALAEHPGGAADRGFAVRPWRSVETERGVLPGGRNGNGYDSSPPWPQASCLPLTPFPSPAERERGEGKVLRDPEGRPRRSLELECWWPEAR